MSETAEEILAYLMDAIGSAYSQKELKKLIRTYGDLRVNEAEAARLKKILEGV